MYKRFLFIFSICFITLFIVNVQALSTYDNSLIQDFYDNEFDEDYPYCIGQSSLSIGGFSIFCIQESYLSDFYLLRNGTNYKPVLDSNVFVLRSVFSSGSSTFTTKITSYQKNSYFIYNLAYVFSNFDFYAEEEDNSHTLLSSNFQFKETSFLTIDIPDGYIFVLKDLDNNVIDEYSNNKYKLEFGNYTYSIFLEDVAIIEDESLTFNHETTIKPLKKVIFNIPDESVFELKDMKNNIINSSNNIYYLPVGNYVYSLTKTGYFSKENIEISIVDDTTINLTLDSKFNSNTMSSIFTEYYSYIKDLVIDLFPLENPLFIYLISIFIGFFLISLIRKMIGGII